MGTKRLSLWRTSFLEGLRAASLVQFTIAGICMAIFAISGFSNGSGSGDFVNDLGYLIGLPLLYNGFIWIIITLPLSLICATIFWRVTKFPKDSSVF